MERTEKRSPAQGAEAGLTNARGAGGLESRARPDPNERPELSISLASVRLLARLEHGAFRRDRHCEERSDEAIQGTKSAVRSPWEGRPTFPWIASP
jgi:hypothetical protein